MEELIQYTTTHWIEMLFTGVLIPTVGLIIQKIFKSNKTKNNLIQEPNKIIDETAFSVFNYDSEEVNINKQRPFINILFIDDDTKFKVISILKNSGWVKTKILKDIKSINQEELINAHIVFVDIQGVGKLMGFDDEGLGLAACIKEKYPDKKVIIYSAENSGTRFHKAFRLADDMLSKNAVPYEFESIIESMVSKLIEDGQV